LTTKAAADAHALDLFAAVQAAYLPHMIRRTSNPNRTDAIRLFKLGFRIGAMERGLQAFQTVVLDS